MTKQILLFAFVSLSALTASAAMMNEIVFRCEDSHHVLVANTPNYCLNTDTVKAEYVDTEKSYYRIAYCGQLQAVTSDSFVLQTKSYTNSGTHKKYMFVVVSNATDKLKLTAMAATQAKDSTYDYCINADDIEKNSIIHAVHVNFDY